MGNDVGRIREAVTRRRDKPTRSTPAGASFVLAIVEGPDTGLVLTLDASNPQLLLGQSRMCSLRLSDPEVSRRHAAFSFADDHLRLIDLGSTNGTTVNGVAVKEAALVGGEAIRTGRTVLTVQREAPGFVDLTQAPSFGRVKGESRAMRTLYPVLGKLAGADTPFLVEGESGTGKKLVAREIHLVSQRHAAPFVTVDASGLPAEALGARLFGDGGATSVFEEARGGIVFLQEVGELPRELQSRLRDAIAAGSSVRFIASTTRNLDADVAGGRLDAALFQALASSRVELPPLREREGDVALLARHFWSGDAGTASSPLPEDFLPRFEDYPWPGNVRELQSAVEARKTLGELGQAHRFQESKHAALDFLSAVIEDDLPFPRARERVVKEFERRYVARVLAREGGSVTKAARASGVAHRYFQLIRSRLK